jgi:hypothetical protein
MLEGCVVGDRVRCKNGVIGTITYVDQSNIPFCIFLPGAGTAWYGADGRICSALPEKYGTTEDWRVVAAKVGDDEKPLEKRVLFDEWE